MPASPWQPALWLWVLALSHTAWWISLLRDWPQLLVGEDKVKNGMANALQGVRTKLINLSALHYGAVSTAGGATSWSCMCACAQEVRC